jgi:hypothetical protein
MNGQVTSPRNYSKTHIIAARNWKLGCVISFSHSKPAITPRRDVDRNIWYFEYAKAIMHVAPRAGAWIETSVGFHIEKNLSSINPPHAVILLRSWGVYAGFSNHVNRVYVQIIVGQPKSYNFMGSNIHAAHIRLGWVSFLLPPPAAADIISVEFTYRAGV